VADRSPVSSSVTASDWKEKQLIDQIRTNSITSIDLNTLALTNF
jgi:hypothetical protein